MVDITKEKAPSLEDRLTHKGMLLKHLLEYGIDIENRSISLTGEVDDDMFNMLDLGMTYMENQSGKSITIKISSYGGYYHNCLAIVGRIRESKCKVHTKGYGKIMSSATLILASGTGKRSISEYTRFMWHELNYDLDRDRHSVNVHEVDVCKQDWKLFCEYMASFTDKDFKFWKRKGEGKDWYPNVHYLIDLGVVDEVF